jgi:hypothetical protein
MDQGNGRIAQDPSSRGGARQLDLHAYRHRLQPGASAQATGRGGIAMPVLRSNAEHAAVPYSRAALIPPSLQPRRVSTQRSLKSASVFCVFPQPVRVSAAGASCTAPPFTRLSAAFRGSTSALPLPSGRRKVRCTPINSQSALSMRAKIAGRRIPRGCRQAGTDRHIPPLRLRASARDCNGEKSMPK